MILIDTNVFSEIIRPIPDPKVVDWLYERRGKTLLSSLVAAGIDLGIRTTPGPAKRRMLERWFARLIEQHSGRIVNFDLAAARCWAGFNTAVLLADIRAGTRPMDLLLAAQALALDVPFATRNAIHFEDTEVRVIDPWTD